jgi:hypothetical protein
MILAKLWRPPINASASLTADAASLPELRAREYGRKHGL